MKTEIVNVEDVFPDENNPRKDFGNIGALAQSMEINSDRPGEPLNPPVVVKDGGIYRIVDGERRYRAIKKNGLSRCTVAVCENMDEANSIVSMLATDDKQQLTDIEKSRGVQQMLLLGVDPAKVDKAARTSIGTANRVATAMAKVDDAAEDMTLDRLLAIEEFSDDREAVEKLTNAKESEWNSIAMNIRRIRENAKTALEIRAALSDAGIPIIAEIDDGMRYVGSCHKADDLFGIISDNEGETLSAIDNTSEWSNYFSIYLAREESEPDPVDEKRDKEIDMVLRILVDAKKHHTEFFFKVLDSPEDHPHTVDFVMEKFFEHNGSMVSSALERFEIDNDVHVDMCPSRLDLVLGWSWRNCDIADSFYAEDVCDGESMSWREDRMSDYLRLHDAMISDGHEETAEESEIIDSIRNLICGGDAE